MKKSRILVKNIHIIQNMKTQLYRVSEAGATYGLRLEMTHLLPYKQKSL
jgi:hypothetical protein